MNVRGGKIWKHGALATGAALVLLLVVAAALETRAATSIPTKIYVRTDGSDANCDGTANTAYSAEEAPLCATETISQGIALVIAGGTVIVGPGEYVENISIAKDLTLLGAGAADTVIDGGGSGRVVSVDLNSDVTISGFTIRNGSAATPGGGGIYLNSSTSFTLTHSTVSSNTVCSGCGGGGLYALGSTITIVISDSSFSDNMAGGSGGSGGAVRNWLGALTIVSSTFASNTADEKGGAIFSGGSGSTLTIVDSTLFDNSVVAAINAYGGAIYGEAGTHVISDTTIISNTSSHAGGGISLVAGTTRIAGSLIASNTATSTSTCYGGGIRIYNGTLTIEDSVLRNNRVTCSSGLGGAIVAQAPTVLNRVTVSGNTSNYRSGGINAQDMLTMTNVTVSGNSAYDAGGGIRLVDKPAITMTLVNCTIADNILTAVSPFGAGGIHTERAVVMAQTLLAGNDNGNCAISSIGSIQSGGANLEDDDTCNLGAKGDFTATIPLISTLGQYGGPMVGATGSQERMRLHALERNSPAIDAGDDAVCPAVDQRGVARPLDGDRNGNAICDIGAYEYDMVNEVALPLILRND